jgi:hypothetical protein
VEPNKDNGTEAHWPHKPKMNSVIIAKKLHQRVPPLELLNRDSFVSNINYFLSYSIHISVVDGD